MVEGAGGLIKTDVYTQAHTLLKIQAKRPETTVFVHNVKSSKEEYTPANLYSIIWTFKIKINSVSANNIYF